MLRLLCVALLALLTANPAFAHKASDSYLTLTAADAAVAGEWKIALRDLDYAIGLDGDGDGAITWGELRERHAAIDAYALARLDIARGGQSCTLVTTDHLVDDLSDGAYSVLRFSAGCPVAGALAVTYALLFDLDPQHRGLLRLDAGNVTQTAIFSPDQRTQTFAVATPTPLRHFVDYGIEGIWHIWTGYDHILFLVTLLLPAVLRRGTGRWEQIGSLRQGLWQVAGIVTAFTFAHSITLSLAALDLVRLPSRLVESAIAASIVVAALNNLWPLVTRRLWLVAFAFGLMHGFGFATVLAELGLPPRALIPALLGFNLGVEIGQLAIVAAIMPIAFLLRGWRYYPPVVLRAGSTAIVALAMLWLVERAFDLRLAI